MNNSLIVAILMACKASNDKDVLAIRTKEDGVYNSFNITDVGTESVKIINKRGYPVEDVIEYCDITGIQISDNEMN